MQDILGYAPALHESRQADLPTGRERTVFQYVVELTGGWPDARMLARVRALLKALQPAHTTHLVTDAVSFVVHRGIVGRTVI